MRRTGAWLLVYALERLGTRFTFGIPGVHVTEIYDELDKSEKIQPVLVSHECGGAFMADAVSRTTDSVGVLVVVPAAGMTHAMSGIGEAFLDGIPMLIISGGTRRDSGKSFQLHQMDQQRLMEPITKGTFLVRDHNDVVPTIFRAHQLAVSGEPGPVFVEIPVEIQMFKGAVEDIPQSGPPSIPLVPDPDGIDRAVDLLCRSKAPGLFVGWGARFCTDLMIDLAERFCAPVSTTLQGLSVFPASHRLHTGMGFGPSAVPAAENAFEGCDCLLAVGTRFGEIPTGSFGANVPENLIHVDINRHVFDKNYPSKVAILGDARDVLTAILERVPRDFVPARSLDEFARRIEEDKAQYIKSWSGHTHSNRVNPALFFHKLRLMLDDDAYVVVDDGNHTFLAAELFPVHKSRHFISPTDFNCMGYATPAAVGVKLAHRDSQVVAVVGDGAFLMTCMEIVTAASLELGVVFFVFNDGELSQIAQSQKVPYNKKTCTVLGELDYQGVAVATGAAYRVIQLDSDIMHAIKEAQDLAREGRPVIVDVHIDTSKQTRFTKGVIKTNLSRFAFSEKFRFVGRSIVRRIRS